MSAPEGMRSYKVVVTGYAYGTDLADAEAAAAGGDWVALDVHVIDEEV